MRTFSRFLFTTLTYSRAGFCRHWRWWHTSRHVTDYVQRLRRGTGQHVEYLRVLESHKDYNPHVHMLLYFPNPFRIQDKRYIARDFFDKLQHWWPHGFSKPEVIRSDVWNYTLKYFRKQLIYGVHSPFSTRSRLTVYPLKGKVVVMFAMPIRVLTWSRGMQELYKQYQQTKLVLSPDTPQDALVFHI